MADRFFQDKVVIVTGAASGIGLATAEHFAAEGARLVEPAEVAALAAFLCRDEASTMSGSPVMIDLAWTAG